MGIGINTAFYCKSSFPVREIIHKHTQYSSNDFFKNYLAKAKKKKKKLLNVK